MRVNIKHLVLITVAAAAAACHDYERSVAAPSGDYASQQDQKAKAETQGPIVRITSPFKGDVVAGGEGTAGAGSGLAFRIAESGYRLNIPRMFAALLLLSVAGIVIYGLLALVSHLVLRRWHESALGKEN